MKCFLVDRKEPGPLVRVLASKLGVSRKKAKRLLDAKCVFVNGVRLWMAQAPMRGGERIEVHEEPKEAKVTLKQLLYQDEEFVIWNKPPGITTDGTKSLEVELRETLHLRALCAVHRLDRDTSGCVIFAKSSAVKDKAEVLFRQHKVRKIYHAIVHGAVPVDLEEITRAVNGKAAVSKLHIISTNSLGTYLEVEIVTGRTHQIRKHMASIEHPVMGDREYISRAAAATNLRGVPRQMLHARSLHFENPVSAKVIEVAAPLPKDFLQWLEKIELGPGPAQS